MMIDNAPKTPIIDMVGTGPMRPFTKVGRASNDSFRMNGKAAADVHATSHAELEPARKLVKEKADENQS